MKPAWFLGAHAQEFVAALRDVRRHALRKGTIKKVFVGLDKDHDGVLTAREVQAVMPEGTSLAEAQVRL